MLYKSFEFKEIGDERGNLVVIEGEKTIPFSIKRMFYMYGTDNSKSRGLHANRNSSFLMICVSGSCKVLVDDGRGNKEIINLDHPNKGLLIPKMIWKEMFDFSDDCVLLVLSDCLYDGGEYLRDYDEFIKVINENI